jgi:hypothetical protein
MPVMAAGRGAVLVLFGRYVAFVITHRLEVKPRHLV